MAVMGNVQAMYHQVQVPEADRDFLQFLWWAEGDLTKELSEFRMTDFVWCSVFSELCDLCS